MKIENLKNGLAKITIEVTGEKLENLRKDVLALFKDKEVKGFRKGKVPADVLEKEFSEDIHQQMLNQIVREEYSKALKNKEIEPMGELSLIDYKVEKDIMIVNLQLPVEPEFDLPQYKGLNIPLDEVSVSDEEVNEHIKNLELRSAETIEVKEKAKSADKVTIDFEGFVDGVAFEGGKAENHELVLGSKSFIDTFEQQIEGHSVNDEFDVNVTFPENYHAENLKGKKALFKVKLNKIERKKETEINDELAKKYKFNTLDEYKDDVKKQLLKNKELEAKNVKIGKILEKIKNEVKYEVPESLVNMGVHREIEQMRNQLNQYGMQLEQYLQMMGEKEDTFIEKTKERVKDGIKVQNVLYKIRKHENLDISDEELQKGIKEDAVHHGLKYDELSNEDKIGFDEHVYNKLMSQKIIDLLLKNN